MRNIDIYRRYFRITEGPIVERLIEVEEINKAAREEYTKILKDLGAKTGTWMATANELNGMFFDEPPCDSKYKRASNGSWYPKRNNKWGREVHKRISAVETATRDSALEVAGIKKHNHSVWGDGSVYFPTAMYLPRTQVSFIILPWFDADPKEIEEYKKSEGIDSNMEAISFEIPSGWQEVKRWELEREVDEYNEALESEQ